MNLDLTATARIVPLTALRRRRLSTRISGDCSSEKDARNRTDRRSAKAMNPNLRMSMIKIVEEPMKRPTCSLTLFVGVAICALQPAAATNAQGLGPSMNKGLNYDGTYAGVSVVNNSQGNT